jgi:aspartyl-tRNA(Asn)/glutamyl-tRNA(Gln) amidotransferase subunit B
MRSKEDAQDYRYFPDPDLLPLVIADAWIERVRAEMPELPEAKRARLEREHGLAPYDAAALTATREMADWFEATLAALPGQAKLCANWVMGEISARLNRDEIELAQARSPRPRSPGCSPASSTARCPARWPRKSSMRMWAGEGSADAIIEARGLKQISDSGAIEKIIDEVLAANPKSVEEFRAGKDKAFNALVGQVMKASKGKANPQQVNEPSIPASGAPGRVAWRPNWPERCRCCSACAARWPAGSPCAWPPRSPSGPAGPTGPRGASA